MAPLRIAIIEDLPDFRHTLVDALGSVPQWEVVAECPDADHALRTLTGQRPDLVLLDLGLPGTSGLDAIRPLKAKLGSECAIVVLSRSQSGADIFQAIREGACSYLFKSMSRDTLIQAIRDVAEGKAPLLGAAVSRRLMLWIQRDHEADRHGLSDREWQILQLAARGKQGPEIAGLLEISNNTVKNHFRNIYTKLDVHSRADALIKIKGGGPLIDPDSPNVL